MVLGNTGVKNLGKKYLTKNSKKKSTNSSVQNNVAFFKWFETEYLNIVGFISSRSAVDYDVLHDTFLKISDKILYGGIGISKFDGYFYRAYYTNSISRCVSRAKFTSICESTDNIDVTEDNSYVLENIDVLIAAEKYVSERFNKTEYDIFNSYYKGDDNASYRSVAKDHGVTVHHVHKTINRVTAELMYNHKNRHL